MVKRKKRRKKLELKIKEKNNKHVKKKGGEIYK